MSSLVPFVWADAEAGAGAGAGAGARRGRDEHPRPSRAARASRSRDPADRRPHSRGPAGRRSHSRGPADHSDQSPAPKKSPTVIGLCKFSKIQQLVDLQYNHGCIGSGLFSPGVYNVLVKELPHLIQALEDIFWCRFEPDRKVAEDEDALRAEGRALVLSRIDALLERVRAAIAASSSTPGESHVECFGALIRLAVILDNMYACTADRKTFARKGTVRAIAGKSGKFVVITTMMMTADLQF